MNDNLIDDMQRPLNLLETLCDFACIGGSHAEGQIDMDNLSFDAGYDYRYD